MPATPWNECLKPGTPEYLRAKKEGRSKLVSIKHIVDYYYGMNGFANPSPLEGVAVNSFRQPKSAKEPSIREAICHHFACDGVPPAIHDVTQGRLRDLLADAYRVQGLWQEASGQLTARAGDVSYAKLYEVVLALADGATTDRR